MLNVNEELEALDDGIIIHLTAVQASEEEEAQIKTEGGIFLPDTMRKPRNGRGEVLSIGPNVDSTNLKVGDTVIFPLNAGLKEDSTNPLSPLRMIKLNQLFGKVKVKLT